MEWEDNLSEEDYTLDDIITEAYELVDNDVKVNYKNRSKPKNYDINLNNIDLNKLLKETFYIQLEIDTKLGINKNVNAKLIRAIKKIGSRDYRQYCKMDVHKLIELYGERVSRLARIYNSLRLKIEKILDGVTMKKEELIYKLKEAKESFLYASNKKEKAEDIIYKLEEKIKELNRLDDRYYEYEILMTKLKKVVGNEEIEKMKRAAQIKTYSSEIKNLDTQFELAHSLLLMTSKGYEYATLLSSQIKDLNSIIKSSKDMINVYSQLVNGMKHINKISSEMWSSLISGVKKLESNIEKESFLPFLYMNDSLKREIYTLSSEVLRLKEEEYERIMEYLSSNVGENIGP